MRVYVLYLGEMYSDPSNISGGDAKSNIRKSPREKLSRNPCSAVLIDHPEAGWILYDTGMPDEPEKVWPQEIASQLIIEKPVGSRMAEQLALVGIVPSDIRHVITSHMHMDHIGNECLFARTADFYVGKAEAEHAYRTVLQDPDINAHGWYIKDEVLQTRKKVTYIDRDTELFPGIEVITLPGHSPCVLGLVVHLEDEVLIFTADAVYERRNYGGMVPGVIWNEGAFRQSLAKIHKVQMRYGAKVFFGHDAEQFYQDVKKAPDYYGSSTIS